VVTTFYCFLVVKRVFFGNMDFFRDREEKNRDDLTLLGLLQQIFSLLHIINERSTVIMATLKDVQDEIAKVKADVTQKASDVQADIQGLDSQIQALKDQIAAGSPVTAADLDGLVTSLEAVDAGVAAIPPVPVTPAPAA
jgi:hypothetical protein